MKKRSFNYWKKRELANQLNQIKDEKVTIANMEENFNIALEDIEQQINVFYERYAKSQGISIEEALKRVSEHDVKAFEKKAKEYVKKKDFSPEANAQLKLYNATMRINRLELLKAELNLHLTDMTVKNSDLIEKHLEKLADSEYARQSGILDTKLRFSKEGVKAIVNSDYKYGNFSKNIWTNQEALMGNIATMLRRSIIQGANPTDMIGRLRSQFNVSKHEAKRLLVTEASRVQGDVQLDAIEQAGYDEYLYISEPTACEICKQLDGKHFKIKDREVGVNFYPMHPYCKCSSAAYYDSEQLDKEIAEYRKERGLDKAEESGIIKDGNLFEKMVDGFKFGKRNRSSIAKDLLERLGLEDLPIDFHTSGGARGFCGFSQDGDKLKIINYSLEKNDDRERPYQLKTIFHEAYHAKGHGRKFDYADDEGFINKSSLAIEETFAESSAHYAMQKMGVKERLSPAYAEYLVDTVPRLKKLEKYSSINNIVDLGEIAWNDRLKGQDSQWNKLAGEIKKINHDWQYYGLQYEDYIKNHKERLVDKFLENAPSQRKYRDYMIGDIDNIFNKLHNYDQLTQPEKFVYQNVLVNVMNEEGIK